MFHGLFLDFSVSIRYNAIMKGKNAKLVAIFFTFFRVSLFTIGGGYAMVPVLAKNLEKKGWMKKGEFYTLLARSQSIPGSIAFNLSVLVGKRVAGVAGGTVGALGVMIPPFFAIVLVGAVLGKFAKLPFTVGFLKGAYGAIIGLIGGVLYKMILSRKWTFFEVSVAFVAFFLLVLDNEYVLEIFFLAVFFVWMGDRKWKS